MLDLNDVRYFVHVVERGGFTAASAALKVSTSTLSYRVQQLEKDLGIALLSRTSRAMTTTEAGQEFYRHAVEMLERAEEAEASVRRRLTEPAGPVKYSTAAATAQFAMSEMVNSFLHDYPRVTLIQHISEDFVDVVSEGYDLVIRSHTAPLTDSTMASRTLANVPWFLFASPGYLETHGEPQRPADLPNHLALVVERDNVKSHWELSHVREESPAEVVVYSEPRIRSRCMLTLKNAARAGLGIVALPAFVGRDDLRAGTLRRVLPDWITEQAKIAALIPNRRGTSAAVRAFIDHLTAAFPAAVDTA